MEKNSLLVITIILLCIALPFAREKSDFYTIVNSFQHPYYYAEDKKIGLDFDYDAVSTNDGSSSYGYHNNHYIYDLYKQEYSRHIDLNMFFKKESLEGDSLYDYNKEFSINVNGFSNSESKKVTLYNTGISDDTSFSQLQIEGNVSHLWHPKLYKKRKKKSNKYLYLELPFKIYGIAEILKEEKYLKKGLSSNEDIVKEKWIDKTIGIGGNLTIDIGFGRKWAYTPLFKANVIGDALKQMSIDTADKPSKKLIHELASWIMRKKEYDTKYMKGKKFYICELDSLLKEIPTIDTNRLDGYSYFFVDEIYNIHYPQLFRGRKIGFSLVGDVILQYDTRKYYRGDNNLLWDNGGLGLDIFHNELSAKFNIDFGLPVKKKHFFTINFKQYFFYSAYYRPYKSSDYYYQRSREGLLSSTEFCTSWYYWINYKVIFRMFLDDLAINIPSFIFGEPNLTLNAGIDLSIYLTEKLMLSFTYNNEYKFLTLNEYFNYEHRSNTLNLGIIYDL